MTPFRIPLRTRARPGTRLTGAEAGSALHGDDDAIVARAGEFAAAGVDELVVEPMADTLDGFLEVLSRLAALIVDVE